MKSTVGVKQSYIPYFTTVIKTGDWILLQSDLKLILYERNFTYLYIKSDLLFV